MNEADERMNESLVHDVMPVVSLAGSSSSSCFLCSSNCTFHLYFSNFKQFNGFKLGNSSNSVHFIQISEGDSL